MNLRFIVACHNCCNTLSLKLASILSAFIFFLNGESQIGAELYLLLEILSAKCLQIDKKSV